MKNLLLNLPLAAALVLSTQAVAHAEERAWAPYRKLMETTRLDKFAATPLRERDKVQLFATLTPASKGIKPEDVVLTVVDGADRHAAHVGADHKIDLTFNQKWYDDNASMTINQPAGEKMGISFSLEARLPEGLQWPYAGLMGAVPQSNELIKSQAGMLSLFVPTMRSVVLRFAHPAQVKIAAKNGVKVLASDAKNEIWLKPDPALMQENPLMTVSERPRMADLDSD